MRAPWLIGLIAACGHPAAPEEGPSWVASWAASPQAADEPKHIANETVR